MKKFISGILCGALLTIGLPVLANSDEIIAKFTSFNFVVNGQQKSISANPVTINGSSYLPVRDVANMLGYDVTFKADTKTIEFSGDKINIDEIEKDKESKSKYLKTTYQGREAASHNNSTYIKIRHAYDIVKKENPNNNISFNPSTKTIVITKDGVTHQFNLGDSEVISIEDNLFIDKSVLD